MKKYIAIALTAILTALGVVSLATQSATAAPPGFSQDPNRPTYVKHVPKGFEPYGEAKVWTKNCITATKQVYSKTTDPVYKTECRKAVNVYTPGTDEVKEVREYEFKKKVVDYKTEYHFRKFVRVKETTPDIWQNFSPNKENKPFTGPPSWPTDERGTWHHEGKEISPGHTGPDGVYQKGSGNGSWFYRAEGVEGPFGSWTPWEPETHTSWEDSPEPLGTPAFHGQGTYEDGTKWYREWQAMFDGQTRQVEDGYHYEKAWFESDPGAPWKPTGESRVKTKGSPATKGSWSGWNPMLNFADGWTGDAPTVPDVILGSGDQPNGNVLKWFQSRRVVKHEGYTEYVYTLAFEGKPCAPITPAPPVVTDGDCFDRDGNIEVPITEGVIYEIDGDKITATLADPKTSKFNLEGTEYSLNEDGTASMTFTLPVFEDNPACDKPEGFEDTDHTEKCVDGDLVFTDSYEVGTPIMAEDGTWSVEVQAASTQGIEKNAEQCEKDSTPAKPKPGPAVPAALPDTGAPAADEQLPLLAGVGILAMLTGGLLLGATRRRN